MIKMASIIGMLNSEAFWIGAGFGSLLNAFVTGTAVGFYLAMGIGIIGLLVLSGHIKIGKDKES